MVYAFQSAELIMKLVLLHQYLQSFNLWPFLLEEHPQLFILSLQFLYLSIDILFVSTVLGRSPFLHLLRLSQGLYYCLQSLYFLLALNHQLTEMLLPLREHLLHLLDLCLMPKLDKRFIAGYHLILKFLGRVHYILEVARVCQRISLRSLNYLRAFMLLRTDVKYRNFSTDFFFNRCFLEGVGQYRAFHFFWIWQRVNYYNSMGYRHYRRYVFELIN